MLEIELLGVQETVSPAPPESAVRRLCTLAAAAMGVGDGHLAIEFVSEDRIAELNAEHRGKAGPTDVLSFPIDGAEPLDGVGPGVGPLDGAEPLDGVGPLDGAGPLDGVGPLDGAGSIGGVGPIDGARPIDGVDSADPAVPRELGDVVICAEHTEDVATAIVHGVLHLVGLDHERDDGEMLALQAEIMRWERL